MVDSSRSPVTGWAYNDKNNISVDYIPGFVQAVGPGLKFIQGGTFIMGRTAPNIMHNWNNNPRRVSLPSFYMDETEVRNQDYREYLNWISHVYPDYPEVYREALPDTLVWRDRLAYNEPYVYNYFRHPSFNEYPVVGVSWEQANKFCVWRTNRVNEMLLIQNGYLKPNKEQKGENTFDTEAYLAGQYDGNVNTKDGEAKRASISDGVILPSYRLPTEAEWEFAAYGLIGNSKDERVVERKIFPWNGHYLRNPDLASRGKMMANFSRGRGDYMGTAGSLNDGGDFTVHVRSYWPNDYGLYCMAGNVNEWVGDVYRPLSTEDVSDINPYRGNVFMTYVKDQDGNIAEKDSLGQLKRRLLKDEEIKERDNYTTADNRNYKDGDIRSRNLDKGNWNNPQGQKPDSKGMYLSEGKSIYSLISDKSRVFKGGSWRDKAYWLSPGTRRFLDQGKARNDVGFRCAMSHVGSPSRERIK